jgi:hypothetical protein
MPPHPVPGGDLMQEGHMRGPAPTDSHGRRLPRRIPVRFNAAVATWVGRLLRSLLAHSIRSSTPRWIPGSFGGHVLPNDR